MAAGSTIYNFEISLTDVNRGVYESLTLCVAQHPSENLEYLLCRVLAYCFEYREGIEFSRGLAEPDEPALWVHDLTGKITVWIEVGVPSAEKLHKAGKSVERVAIYTHKAPEILLQQLKGKKIHRANEVFLYSFDLGFLTELAAVTERRNTLEISLNDDQLYINVVGKTLHSTIATSAIISTPG